ncbi:ankyrin repeat domain-containing protein [Formosa sp. PL04]|uniref:ankyrin repeat domain-containing protein n=1 Tax=Formosa sp. PL04 TaxID=3081755 RepID=UPI002981D7A4|nr:ankyrin repeat domain-containing protein [Formosa sp. PL04]MDW5289475.1 ankyrin repeat domain-containing protein [Formosa sp. PL04]
MIDIKSIIDEGHLDQIKEAVTNGLDPKTRLEDDATLLHYAAKQGQIEIINYLLDLGLDIEAKSSDSVSPLQMAVDGEHLSAVKLLLERGANIHAHSEKKHQAIHTACFHNQPEILQCLIDYGADVNAKIDENGIPLNIAVENNWIKLIEILIANGANVNHIDDTFFTPLFYALKQDHGEVLELLIKNGADMHHTVPKDITALMYCAKGAKSNCVKPLIDAGYNYREEVNSESPLHSAAIEGYGYVLEMAAKAGVNMNFKDGKGKTMLDYTLENNNAFAIKTLLKSGVVLTEAQVQLAAQNGDYDALAKLVATAPDTIFNNNTTLIHKLIEEGEPELLEELLNTSTKMIDVQDDEGNCPLHLATYAYNQTFTRLLINAGADVTLINNDGYNIINKMHPDISSENILLLKDHPELFTHKNPYNQTPFEYALGNNYIKSLAVFAQILYKMKDATVYANGFTAIQMAAALGEKEVLDELVNENCLNDVNENGENLLWFLRALEAHDKKHSKIGTLIDKGIAVNHKDKSGNTALIQATIKGNSWTIDALLKGGADTEIQDNSGKTALHIATEKEREYVITELLKYGANPEIKDDQGLTARDIAKASSNEGITELFTNY